MDKHIPLPHDGNDPVDFAANAKPSSDFETAIDAAGFGRFNFLLLLVALLAAMSAVFETSTVSYVLPSAECDLQLTLLDKGILNAITYAGMITSAVAWGYVADTKGRKSVLVIGLLIEALCDFGAATSQSVLQLMIFKYLGGLNACGPFAVLMSYLSEMHGRRVRSFIMMITGIMFATSSVLLPTLATVILPNEWNFRIGYLSFKSWQIFMCISALPACLSGFLLILFPESPKFLMSQGRNREALDVFRKIYAANTGKPKESYPIKKLDNETVLRTEDNVVKTISRTISIHEDARSCQQKPKTTLKEGLLQLRPLFEKPFLRLSLQVYCINTLVLLGQNTMRLWLPSLFAATTEYHSLFGESSSMCDIIEFGVNKTIEIKTNPASQDCEAIIIHSTYINNIIVGATNFVGFIIVSATVNFIGTKRILLTGTLVAGSCGISLFFSKSPLTTLIMAALYTTSGSISSTSVISSSVSLFPTSLRTMIVSLAMMFGRSGSLTGNVLFPIFMELGCVHPFLLVSIVMYLAFCLSLFLPNTNKAVLK